jgi:hypothetical protein
MTVTAVSTMVQPTTYVKTWVSTQTQDNVSLIYIFFNLNQIIHLSWQTKTVVNTLTSTVTDNRTYLQTVTYLSTATATTTATTTATETQALKETGLSECLGKVRCSMLFPALIPD